MNTNFQYAFYQENFEIYKFQFKTYGHGMWYDAMLNSYDEIVDLIKEIIYEKVQKDNPHLTLLKPDEVIQVKEKDDWDGFKVNNNIHANYDEVKLPNGSIGYVPKKEEPIDKDFNLIDAIKKCKTAKELKTYGLLVKSQEECQAYDTKMLALKSKTSNTVNQ